MQYFSLCSSRLNADHCTFWNGMLHHYFVVFYFARLEVTVPLAFPMYGGGNKGSNSVLGNFLTQNTFSKSVALIVKEGRIRLEVDKNNFIPFVLCNHIFWVIHRTWSPKTRVSMYVWEYSVYTFLDHAFQDMCSIGKN